MNRRLRQERTVFLLYLGAVFVSLMSALPIVTASLSAQRFAVAQPQTPRELTFEQLDRNRDGFVDRTEAEAQPGLSAVFDRADRHPDGLLDKVEYGKALSMIGPRT
ncbi:MAG: hypothetical protein JOZ85_12080 [Betaproteobacteria bacterium]|nr:hypothetical protein [Betaproteobacteria bacterium]